MPTLPTLPKRPWSERILFILAGALVVIGLFVLALWWLSLGQPWPELTPMHRMEAAAFVLLGLAVGARVSGWHAGESLGILPAIWALFGLVYAFADRGGALTGGFPSGSAGQAFGPPNRTPALTAACVLLGSLPLAIFAWKRESRGRAFYEAAVGSLLVGVAFSTLLSYGTGQTNFLDGVFDASISPVAAFGLIVLGGCLLMFAWRNEQGGGPAAWAPVPAIVVPLLMTLTLWIELRERETSYINMRTQAAMDKFMQAADIAIEHELNAFERFGRKWADTPSDTREARELDAAAQLAESGPLGCVSIASVDPAGVTRWIFPRNEAMYTSGQAAVGARRAVLEQTGKDGRPTISATTDIILISGSAGRQRPGFVLAAPVAQPGRATEFVTAEFLYETFFSAIATGELKLGDDYHFSVSIGGNPVFEGGAGSPSDDRFAVDRGYSLFDRRVALTAVPASDMVGRDRHPISSLMLFSGLSLTGLFVISVILARKAALGRRAAELSNLRLLEENEERRRVENRLKVSDERLRLALDSTEIGIFEWNVTTGQTFYSAGLWGLLGYDPAGMAATFQTWEALVHPDDLPAFVARIQKLRQGVATAVESESRVRSGSGDWRWIYVRAKCVSFDSNRRPARVIGTMQDVTARVEIQHHLQRAKTEADAASRAKSEFLASMSHEIRTPLNGIIGMTSLMVDTELAAEQRDYVETIRASSDALLGIVNEILDFSKIESGRMEIEHLPFALAPCLEEALDLVAKTAEEKNLEIGYCIAPGVPHWVTGDSQRLWQVVSNLVNNGVKFTQSGSVSVEVRLGAGAPAGRICLEFIVRDTGIGIPPERMNRLFKPFSQVDSSTTRMYGGTGLGLAICERLCQLMGGGVRVESAVDVGSTFTFTILTEEAARPADAPDLPPVPAALGGGPVLCVSGNATTRIRLRSLLASWGVSGLFASNGAAAVGMAGVIARPALLIVDQPAVANASMLGELALFRCPTLVLVPFGRMPLGSNDQRLVGFASKPLKNAAFFQEIVRLFAEVRKVEAAELSLERKLAAELPLKVLLAEDNVVNQKVALGFLERLGYHADLAENGLQVLAMVGKQAYDLILMDLQMPEMDGLEASREIRARLSAERVPKIIALTANALLSDRDRCIAAGMDDYIPKPVKLHEIVAVIRRQFGHPAKQD